MTPIEMTDSVNQSAQQDESAVAAVRGGDPERYRELVERHERRVYAVAWSRLGDAALAEEVTQEAFIRAYRRLWLLGDGAKFAGWVNTIARHVAINLGLRHRRELNKCKRWALENLDVSGSESPGGENDPVYTPETLRQALAELPDAHRECLVLFYLEGKSGAEAAAVLEISESALRVRLHRARAAMRTLLEAKLEGSLAQLRPSKSLVPVVMAGVLASSSAKAASGGLTAVGAGMLVKLGFAKWLLPFAWFFQFIILLPMLALSWFMLRLELKNFRDPKGFRARLFQEQSRWAILWIALMMVGMFAVMPRLHIDDWKTFYLVLSGFLLVLLPFQIRRVSINRNRYSVTYAVSVGVVFLLLLLTGLGWVSLATCMVLIIFQPLVMLWLQTQTPGRMDYNLFLRGAEGLLKGGEPTRIQGNHSQKELLAFGRFLGARWLATGYGWTEDGLRLRMPQTNATVWHMLRNLPGWAPKSCLLLQFDGTVTAQLGQQDRTILQRMEGEKLPSIFELENTVALAVRLAWGKFDEGDVAGAVAAIGEVADTDVFIKTRGRTLSAKVQGGIVIGSILFIAAVFCLPKFLGGSFPSLSFQDISRHNYRLAMSNLKTSKTEEKRFYALDAAAKESFVAGKIEESRSYAQELMMLLPKYKSDWNYGNAVQDANLVFGRIAVRDGNITAAKKYLIAAGKSPGSPQMDSFGPNMTLAKDLLQRGERDTVLEYFMLCRRFWKNDRGKLDEWKQEVMSGHPPDFGANLLY
jgi:RNA polymerase sigma factor (sigma-70 family)